MIAGATVPIRLVEDYPDGMRVNELDLEGAAGWVAPFKASIFTVEPRTSSPIDEHDVRECWVVIAGQGELTVAGEMLQLAPGSVTYFESRRPHRVRNVGEDTLKIFSVWWPSHG